jgi:hypothetical protein
MPSLVREPSPLAALPRLPRPKTFEHGQWAAARLDSGDLGPSMLEVVAFYPLGTGGLSAAELEAALGPATGEHAVRMSKLAVAALLPAAAAGAREVGDDVELTGPGYSSKLFEGGGFFGARVVQLAAGLLVAVRTGG